MSFRFACGYQQPLWPSTGAFEHSGMRELITDLQFRLEWLGLRALMLLANLLPAELCIRASGRIWAAIAPHLKRHPRARAHIALALPELSREAREAILEKMWRQLGMTFAEALMLSRLARDPARLRYSGDSQAIVARARKEPTVFASLHMGNWEVCAWAAQLQDVAVCGVYQKVRNPYVERLLLSARAAFYEAGIVPKGGTAARFMIRALQKHQSVAMMADLRETFGLAVPFLGQMAPSTPFPATLARSHGCRLVAARALRVAPGRFVLDAVEIKVPQTEDRRADIGELTAALHRQFEIWVREHPEQWMWAHRRFSR